MLDCKFGQGAKRAREAAAMNGGCFAHLLCSALLPNLCHSIGPNLTCTELDRQSELHVYLVAVGAKRMPGSKREQHLNFFQCRV